MSELKIPSSANIDLVKSEFHIIKFFLAGRTTRRFLEEKDRRTGVTLCFGRNLRRELKPTGNFFGNRGKFPGRVSSGRAR